MNTLSPLTLFNIRATEHLRQEQRAEEGHGRKRKPRIEPVYICPVCGDHHDWEEGAIECCAGPEAVSAAGDADVCPVCNLQHTEDTDAAADCCLWKDTTPTQRWQIARKVEAGSPWMEAIAQVTGVAS